MALSITKWVRTTIGKASRLSKAQVDQLVSAEAIENQMLSAQADWLSNSLKRTRLTKLNFFLARLGLGKWVGFSMGQLFDDEAKKAQFVNSHHAKCFAELTKVDYAHAGVAADLLTFLHQHPDTQPVETAGYRKGLLMKTPQAAAAKSHLRNAVSGSAERDFRIITRLSKQVARGPGS